MGGEVSGLLGRVGQLLAAAGIPFMVAGSFASTAYGLPRSTHDLDLVIDPPSYPSRVEGIGQQVARVTPTSAFADAPPR